MSWNDCPLCGLEMIALDDAELHIGCPTQAPGTKYSHYSVVWIEYDCIGFTENVYVDKYHLSTDYAGTYIGLYLNGTYLQLDYNLDWYSFTKEALVRRIRLITLMK